MECKEMTIDATQRVQQIHLHDGYRNEPFWEDGVNSTYFNYEVDKQCRVPVRSLEEVKKELGIPE